MSKHSSLRETLKELENLSQVKTHLDPEDEDFEGGRLSTFKEVDQQDNNQQDGEGDTAGRVAEEDVLGNLRRKNVAVEDGETDVKYAGEKSSRKNLSAWSDDEEDEDDDDNDEDEDGEGDVDMDGDDDRDDEDEEEEDGDEEDEFEDDELESPDTKMNSLLNEESDDDDENEDIDEDEDGIDSEEDEDGAMNIDFHKLPDDLKGSITQKQNGDDDEEEDTISHFKASVDNNIAKGKATKRQLDILDKLLESRIRLQKSLHVCNQLPQQTTMQEFRNTATPQVKESYEAAKTSMKELMNKLLSLQEKLCTTNVETSSILTTGKVTSTDPGDEEIPSDTEDEDEEKETER